MHVDATLTDDSGKTWHVTGDLALDAAAANTGGDAGNAASADAGSAGTVPTNPVDPTDPFGTTPPNTQATPVDTTSTPTPVDTSTTDPTDPGTGQNDPGAATTDPNQSAQPVDAANYPPFPGTELHRDDQQHTPNPDVKTWQQAIKDHGDTEVGPVDGFFGPKTEGAVKRAETAVGMEPSGVIDAVSWPLPWTLPA